MAIDDELKAQILRYHFVEHWRVGTIASQLGVHHSTVERVLGEAGVERERQRPRRPSKLDSYMAFITETLERFPTLSAARLFDMVTARGYTGGPDHFRHRIAQLRPRRSREAYLRLRTLAGEQAQVDWAHFGKLTIGRAERPLMAFVMVLSYSRYPFVRFYLGASLANLIRGHVEAFSVLGGTARVLLYDNMKSVVLERRGDAIRFHPTLLELAAHYRFEPRLVAPARGNEKGAVEGLVGWSRRNFMVPLPRFASLEALNLYLEQRCRERQGDVLRGHRESIAKRLERDLEAMTALPGAPFDACHQAAGQVSSQSLVRYHNNDYSVPVAYGYRQVWVRGYVDRVVIGCAAEVIARHPRSYEGEDMVFDPLHYLPLIERKIGALDQAAPLAGWELPDAFATLRRLMEARSGRAGRREYVQVLRLFETFGTDDVHAAVRHALRLGAIGFDAVKHLVLCRVEKRPPKLDLDVYPYLPKANVGKTCAASYLCLMSGCVR